MARRKPKRTTAARQAEPIKRAPPKPAPRTYLLFGTDEYAKPRAAKFVDADPELLAKAAAAMNLRMFEQGPGARRNCQAIADRQAASQRHRAGAVHQGRPLL